MARMSAKVARWARRVFPLSGTAVCAQFDVPAILPVLNPVPGVNPLSTGPNPLVIQGMEFTAFTDTGAQNVSPQSEIRSDGGYIGLECGHLLDIQLPLPAYLVRVLMIHFAQPAIISAFDATGATVWINSMSSQQVPQGFHIWAAAISRVQILCPANESRLLEICCER